MEQLRALLAKYPIRPGVDRFVLEADLVVAILAEHDAAAWKPIETAPQEPGTRVLAWWPLYGLITAWRAVGGRWFTGIPGSGVHCDVTHWMPFPPAPKDEGAGPPV